MWLLEIFSAPNKNAAHLDYCSLPQSMANFPFRSISFFLSSLRTVLKSYFLHLYDMRNIALNICADKFVVHNRVAVSGYLLCFGHNAFAGENCFTFLL